MRTANCWCFSKDDGRPFLSYTLIENLTEQERILLKEVTDVYEGWNKLSPKATRKNSKEVLNLRNEIKLLRDKIAELENLNKFNKSEPYSSPCVYFLMQPGITNDEEPALVKIGKAQNYHKRISQATSNSFCPWKNMDLIALVKGYSVEEMDWHNFFKDKRIEDSKEWFRLSKNDVLKAVGERNIK